MKTQLNRKRETELQGQQVAFGIWSLTDANILLGLFSHMTQEISLGQFELGFLSCATEINTQILLVNVHTEGITVIEASSGISTHTYSSL